jgi:hypothetical protein
MYVFKFTFYFKFVCDRWRLNLEKKTPAYNDGYTMQTTTAMDERHKHGLHQHQGGHGDELESSYPCEI